MNKHDILSALRYQYPVGVTTMGRCPLCASPSRGGGKCKTCLFGELIEANVSVSDVSFIARMLDRKQKAEIEIQEIVEKWE